MTTDTEKYLALLDIVRDASSVHVPGGCWCFRDIGPEVPHSPQCHQIREFLEAHGWQDMADFGEPAHEVADRIRRDYEAEAREYGAKMAKDRDLPLCPRCGVQVAKPGMYCWDHGEEDEGLVSQPGGSFVVSEEGQAVPVDEKLLEAFAEVKKDYQVLDQRLRKQNQDILQAAMSIMRESLQEAKKDYRHLESIVDRLDVWRVHERCLYQGLVARVEAMERQVEQGCPPELT